MFGFSFCSFVCISFKLCHFLLLGYFVHLVLILMQMVETLHQQIWICWESGTCSTGCLWNMSTTRWLHIAWARQPNSGQGMQPRQRQPFYPSSLHNCQNLLLLDALPGIWGQFLCWGGFWGVSYTTPTASASQQPFLSMSAFHETRQQLHTMPYPPLNPARISLLNTAKDAPGSQRSETEGGSKGRQLKSLQNDFQNFRLGRKGPEWNLNHSNVHLWNQKLVGRLAIKTQTHAIRNNKFKHSPQISSVGFALNHCGCLKSSPLLVFICLDPYTFTPQI